MNDKSYARNVALTAMNILDGVEVHTHWEGLQPVWERAGMGFIEFCGWLADFAIASEDALRAAPKEQEFPGVYDYEVSYELGTAIRDRMLSSGALPSDEVVRHWLVTLSDAFFEQGEKQ